MTVRVDPSEYRYDITPDRPISGMWHTGPNPCWVTVTHLPTMIQARSYHEQQWKARDAARAAVDLLMDAAELRGDMPRFTERFAPTPPKET